MTKEGQWVSTGPGCRLGFRPYNAITMLMDLRERLEHLVRQELDRRGLRRMYPTVMLREERICFRLSDPKTKGISEWSEWLPAEEVQLEHPEPVVDQVRALLVDLGYAPDVVEEHPQEPPSFDNLVEILRRLPERVPSESMQLVRRLY